MPTPEDNGDHFNPASVAYHPPSKAVARTAGPQLATVADLETLATLMYRGGCTPPGIDSPAKVAVVILAGLEVGLSPTQALGCIMLAGGKPSIYGDGAMALVRASGLLESIREWVDGDGEDRTGHCKLKRKGEEERHYTFSVRDANKAGLIERAKGKGPWVAYQDRMLVMRARGFGFRDIFADVLRGLVLAEEALDMVQAAEVRQVEAPALPPREQPAIAPPTAADEADSAQADGPVTTFQLDQIRDLKPHVLPGDAKTDAERAAAWLAILEPYAVKSAKDLTSAQAANLIGQMEAKVPFFGTGQTAS